MQTKQESKNYENSGGKPPLLNLFPMCQLRTDLHNIEETYPIFLG